MVRAAWNKLDDDDDDDEKWSIKVADNICISIQLE